jgi:hypothetical protein
MASELAALGDRDARIVNDPHGEGAAD